MSYDKNVPKNYSYLHGGALCRSEDGSTEFYDAGRRLIRRNPSIVDIAHNLVCISRAYLFELIL